VKGLKKWWRGVRPYVLSGAITTLVKFIGATLRIKVEGYDPERDAKGRIFAGWHGRTLLGALLFRGKGVWTIISHSRDGEFQSRIFQNFGFNIIRGSTGRGGVRAAVESIRVLRDGGVMAFTPDGPRGPSGVVQEGIMVMAQKSGALLVPVGVAAKPCYRVPTWDAYMVPLPFAKAIMLFGEPLAVPKDASPEDVEAIRLRFEQEMHRLEDEAERRIGNRR